MLTHVLFDPHKTRLLSICCTFRRPGYLKELLETFYATKSEGTEIFIYLHDDDPFIEEYLPIVKDQSYVLDCHRTLCKTLNHTILNLFPGIPYYQVANDDLRYRTKAWDSTLISALQKNNDLGCVSPRYIDDGDVNWKQWQHPSAEIYSWKFVNALGYVYPTDFDAFGGDFYLKDISKAVNGLLYVPEVFIEHLWWGGCGKPPDANITEGYAEEKRRHGQAVYDNWVRTERAAAIERLKLVK